MRTLLKNTIALLLLLPLLAGTLGISAKQHRCSSSNKTSIKLFPELTGQSAGCCCSGQEMPSASGTLPVDENLDSQDCCKTIHLYLKTSFQTTRDQAEALCIPGFTDVCFDRPADLDLKNTKDLKIPVFFTDTGPPLTGRQRVISFHQPKIPCPASCIS
ncbi:MAG: hypothetical protein WCI48_14540 [Bacteroidota bacterium]|jgi:hypothetical protein